MRKIHKLVERECMAHLLLLQKKINYSCPQSDAVGNLAARGFIVKEENAPYYKIGSRVWFVGEPSIVVDPDDEGGELKYKLSFRKCSTVNCSNEVDSVVIFCGHAKWCLVVYHIYMRLVALSVVITQMTGFFYN